MMESVTSMDTSSDFPMTNLSEEGEVEDGELVDDEDDKKIYESESDKLSLRAKRFGLENASVKVYTNPELEKFHKSMGVDRNTRTEALHLLGTENMKTMHIFSYFSGYSPASIEWITDKSCNVVWLDEESCAKALKNRSIKITGQNVDDSDESEESISLEDIRCALPPGIWRKGVFDSLAPQLFIRYATIHDKKGMQPQHINFFGNNGTYNRNIFLDEGDEAAKKVKYDTGNPWADIARQWRHYETKVALQNPPVKDAREMLSHREQRKPKYFPEKLHVFQPKVEEIETKPNLLSSRKMHADIEERKIQERNKLKSQLFKRDKPEIDLRERLGRKRKRYDYDEPKEEVEEKWIREPFPHEKEDLSLRIEIDNTREDSDKEKTWNESKSEGSDSDEVAVRKGASDLRSKLLKKKSSTREKRKHHSMKSVLRTKYMKHSTSGSAPSYPSLRIEIDNDTYKRSSSSSSSSSESSSDSSSEDDN